MLCSTGAFAQAAHGDVFYFVKRQGMWLVIGIGVCVVASLIDYHFWQKTWWLWFAVAVALLILCFVPPFGLRINGSNRWISLGFANFQPSELAKVSTVFFLGWWYSRFQPRTTEFFMGFVFPAAVVAILMALIVIEVDLGATSLIGGLMMAVMFVAGVRLIYLIPVVLMGLGAAVYVAINIPQRAARIMAFLDLEQYRLTEGLQQWQALIAFGSGGVTGLGLGEGRQKMLYLPESHTDFIFPMIGEELGLVATLPVVGAFLVVCVCGFMVATNAKDRFGMLVAFGAIMVIAIQAAVNIGVTTSLLPNKGMPLPFISFGGSNLTVLLFLVGVLINIHRNGHPADAPTRTVRLSARVIRRI